MKLSSEIALLLLSFVYMTLAAPDQCDSMSIACATGGECIHMGFVCDYGDDCSDGSDEDYGLCSVYRNNDCSRGEILCRRNDTEYTYCMPISVYCFFENDECNTDLDKRVCLMLERRKLGDMETLAIAMDRAMNLKKSQELARKFVDLMPQTIWHSDCPPMYTLVGGQCLSIFYIGSMSWGESREFCNILGGDLVTFTSASQYAIIIQHLKQLGLTTDFWIGGRIEEAGKKWAWVDDSAMPLGSPYWATRYSSVCIDRKNNTVPMSGEECFQYSQAPEVEMKGQCAGLSFEHYFYMVDEDCVKKMSPLCVSAGPELFSESDS